MEVWDFLPKTFHPKISVLHSLYNSLAVLVRVNIGSNIGLATVLSDTDIGKNTTSFIMACQYWNYS